MKALLILFVSLFGVPLGDCTDYDGTDAIHQTPPTDTMKLKITVGKVVFTATLYDNATTATLKARLPLHLTMRELNHNEKYGTLPAPLPTDAAHPGTIQAGDLMLYGDDTVVLFYQTFSTSYRYTRLGKLDDVTGLTDALGSGDVPVTLALE